jgi:colanic acid/amylovoran biosynthesis glycosyltransferase
VADRVVVFRKRLLSYSETFIADQGKFLPRYRPLYCGYQQDSSGIELLESASRFLLEDYSRLAQLDKLRFRLGLGGGRAWSDAIAQQSPGLIHAHFLNDGLDAIKLGKRLGLPVVTTLHGHDITKYENAPAKGSTSQRFFAQVDQVIAVSDFIAAQALARGCPEDKLLQHYIGIDLERFTREKQESARPSLLFVGRLVEKKGCTYLLQALQRLVPRFPELTLTIVGEGELRDALRQEAEARQLPVEFAGGESAARIRERLASCWLFVAPSVTAADGDTEGLGMVFLEAQAMQTPVVSFRSGGLVEAVEENASALLCAEKDVDGLSRNIASLLENSTLRHNMGLAGRRRVEQHFDIRKQCVKLESIYAKLA